MLRYYTAYRQAFRLTLKGREISEAEVDADAARKGIMGWVRLHPVNIAARVRIVVEHFRQNVAHLLGGQAKAMVVTASRKEAVRWMRAMSDYVRERHYEIGLLVAFSGEVDDKGAVLQLADAAKRADQRHRRRNGGASEDEHPSAWLGDRPRRDTVGFDGAGPSLGRIARGRHGFVGSESGEGGMAASEKLQQMS